MELATNRIMQVIIYADDMCLAAQSTDWTSMETTLTEDLSKVAWVLQSLADKTQRDKNGSWIL